MRAHYGPEPFIVEGLELHALALGKQQRRCSKLGNSNDTFSAVRQKSVVDIDMSKNASPRLRHREKRGHLLLGLQRLRAARTYVGGRYTCGHECRWFRERHSAARCEHTKRNPHRNRSIWVLMPEKHYDGGPAGCWGSDFHGAFGNDTFTTVIGQGSDLTQAANAQSDIATIVGGGGGSSGVFCSVATDSHLACWGMTGQGEVGNGMFYPPDGGTFD